jgi:N-acetyl-alpha-D-muramate 1-phosphate uridylyltransferase
MTDELAAVVLAAGAGTRLRPLTQRRPKALCPVDGEPLVDLAIGRVIGAVGGAGDVAVNVHHGRGAMEEHLATAGVHLSIEEPEALGTAGALGRLHGWLSGRAVVVVNADAWCPGSVEHLVAGWDGERIRLLVAGEDDLTPHSRIAGALMPWAAVEPLAPEPSGLYEASWATAHAAGEVEVVRHDGPLVDCGTPAQYLEANLLASGGRSVVAEDAVVEGAVDRCVIWAGATVRRGEELTCAIRADDQMTVLVR